MIIELRKTSREKIKRRRKKPTGLHNVRSELVSAGPVLVSEQRKRAKKVAEEQFPALKRWLDKIRAQLDGVVSEVDRFAYETALATIYRKVVHWQKARKLKTKLKRVAQLSGFGIRANSTEFGIVVRAVSDGRSRKSVHRWAARLQRAKSENVPRDEITAFLEKSRGR